ncbi:hypothetical protein [Jannaschia sp. R86511]|uniref:hypothetical protein n=1 Tax=Jannaschia sp. R86511 TaxID=3093853 RepID=UPI0036D381A2
MPAPSAPDRPATHLLPRQHVPPRWRQEALNLLVDTAVAELRAGTSPRRTVRAMAELGAGGPGHDAVAVLDRRLDDTLAAWVERQRRTRLADPDADLEQTARELVAPLFDGLPVGAVDGCPHPGAWVASSVDEVPCAVHGYERDAADCLRMLVETYLVDTIDRAVDRADARPAPLPADGPALTQLWLGVAVLAAWATSDH